MAYKSLTKIIMAKSMKQLKKLSLKITVLATLFIFPFTFTHAKNLIDLDYSVLAGNAVKLDFKFDAAVEAPRTFNIEKPARIAIDFLDTDNKLKQRNLQIGIGAIQSITSASANNRTRVVLNLLKSTEYSTTVSDNVVSITLAGSIDGKAPTTENSQNQVIATAESSNNSASENTAKGITNIDFKRGTNGEGRIIINLTNSSIIIDVRR